MAEAIRIVSLSNAKQKHVYSRIDFDPKSLDDVKAATYWLYLHRQKRIKID